MSRWVASVLSLLVWVVSCAPVSPASPMPGSPTASSTPTHSPTSAPAPTHTSTATKTPTRVPSPADTPTGTPTATLTPAAVTAQVVRVIDGDTIDVMLGGQTYRVRYIGMNTPESDQPCGPEATAVNASLVEGKTVRLEKDVSETDRYGRLLRYVYVGELFVNAELVRLGYAEAATYPPDVRYADLFVELEREARDAGVGCWAEPPPPVENCDPAYPDVCIPPPPPDLDCGDIPYRRFTVLPPDPHRFDGDNDGIGCESG